MKWIFFAAALAVTAPGVAADVAKQGRASVANSLKDPDSARFRDTFINGKSFCGEVNAKNSYGGYVGFRRFVVAAGSASIEDPDTGARSFDDLWRESCWPKGKLDAYHKELKAYQAEIERNIEAQKLKDAPTAASN